MSDRGLRLLLIIRQGGILRCHVHICRGVLRAAEGGLRARGRAQSGIGNGKRGLRARGGSQAARGDPPAGDGPVQNGNRAVNRQETARAGGTGRCRWGDLRELGEVRDEGRGQMPCDAGGIGCWTG